MKSRIYVKVQRPKESDLSRRGILARISDEHFEWLGKVIRKYQSDEVLREMIKNGAPNLTGVKICNKNGDIVALVEVKKENMEGVYRLEYYKKDEKPVIFSTHMNMITKACVILASNVSQKMITEIANVVTSVLYFLYITHCEDECGVVDIVPFQVFGRELYED